MKKITILSLHLGFGGIERSVVSLANILCKKYMVEIVSVYKLYDKPSFDIDDRVDVKYLINGGPNKNEFKNALKSHHVFKIFKEGIKSIKILNLRRIKTINYIKNCDSDVIISTRDIFDEWLGRYGMSSVVKIGWEHNHHHGNMDYAQKIIRSCSKLNYLVLVSESLQKFYKDNMRKYNCKCVFIPNVIENIPENFSKLDECRLVSVGRLSAEKGFLDLLKIFKIIHQKYPNWVLDIVGDGDEREVLSNYIIDNHLEESVTLHGFRTREYIYDLLEKSSIYLMTSFTESFGIVLLEAMSVGLPCIAFTSAEGANGIIVSGYNGYLIKHRNRDAYVKKVKDLIDNAKTRKKIGKQARVSVQKYSVDVVGEDWFKLIEKK